MVTYCYFPSVDPVRFDEGTLGSYHAGARYLDINPRLNLVFTVGSAAAVRTSAQSNLHLERAGRCKLGGSYTSSSSEHLFSDIMALSIVINENVCFCLYIG